MKLLPLFLLLAAICLTACNKPATSGNAPPPSSSPMASSPAMSDNAVVGKLREYSGSGAANCGVFGVGSSSDQLKTASDCATQASQGKKPFYIAYSMPGMSVGVAGDPVGKLYTVQSQGGALTAGECPSQLRVASSGRVTCFAPGDMGSMSGSHTAGSMPQGASNPHTSGKANPHESNATK
ncbi:MAG TPA: hypothetical protein VKV39_06410 [Candidatus Sulfotelmatobacter sp.]|nr:hypothetical protein [Candidatus Sulfotelmatobacter sp.]